MHKSTQIIWVISIVKERDLWTGEGCYQFVINLGGYGANTFFNHKKRVTVSSVFNIGNVHQRKPHFDSVALAPLSGAIPTACLPLMQNRNSYLEGPCKPFCFSLSLVLISSPFNKNNVIFNSKQQFLATYSSLFRRKSLKICSGMQKCLKTTSIFGYYVILIWNWSWLKKEIVFAVIFLQRGCVHFWGHSMKRQCYWHYWLLLFQVLFSQQQQQ